MVSTILLIWGVFGNIRSEIISPVWQERLKLAILFPQVRWYWLVIAFLILTIIAAIEGVYRSYRREFKKWAATHEAEMEKLSACFRSKLGEKDKTIEYKEELFEKERTELQARLEGEKTGLQSRLEVERAEKAELQSQLDLEKAKNAAPEIKGEIREILVDPILGAEGNKAGGHVTIKACIVNVRPIPTRIRYFTLKIRTKGRVYESKSFYTRGLYREDRYKGNKTSIKNLADSLNLPNGLEHRLGEEGYLRFFMEGLIPPREVTHDPGWENTITEDMIFNLEDVENVSLIVTDYFADYEIVSSEIKPQLAYITTG